MDSGDNEVAVDFTPFLRIYKNGRVERLLGTPTVPPSPEDPSTGVASKDIDIISPHIKARIYLPKLTNIDQKLPIFVYYHGGGFCLASSFSFLSQRYLNRLVSESNVIAVSVEYRLAPEHPLPTAYEDSWAALQWVGSHVVGSPGFEKEPWLVNHGDFEKVFIGGDSAGANIVHNMSLRSGSECLNGGINFLGSLLCFPYFLTSEDFKEDNLLSRMWVFVNPSAEDGVDDPRINPFVEKAQSLSRLGCSKILVCVAEKDELRNIGIKYAESVKKSGWHGEIEVIEFEGEDHCFHIYDTETENAKYLIKGIANFIKRSCV